MIAKSFIASLVAIGVSASFPSIDVTVDGQPTTLYLHSPSWSSATTSGNSFSFDFNNRMYLSESPTTDPDSYFTPQMLGGYIEYDVDLSSVGCGCVTAFYGVLMPGIDKDVSDDPFQYCDANRVGGSYCPEFDIMEANMYGFRATSHKCDPATDGIFDSCDHSGQCSVDVLRNQTEDDYGPGSENSIDTT